MSLLSRLLVTGLVGAMLWLAGPAPAEAASAATPSAPQRKLEQALARYRAIAREGGWPIVPGGPVLGRGDEGARVVLLRRRLQRADDLADLGAGNRFDESVDAAVRRFQARHGLATDGRVGARTLAALNVPVATRVAQLAANLVRWRQMRPLESTHIRVNVATATLEAVEDGRVVLTMPVVVGDPAHQTPEFRDSIVAVTLNPPWNVPHSIATREILPRLRREPGYLAANNIRILDRPSDPFGRAIDWRRIAAQGFPFRLQQQPGPRNSLGLIKFEMPNPYDIYLHDTPAKALFERRRRTLSHGCIRVAQPRELAAFVLRDGAWTGPAIDAAIATGVTQRVPVEAPVPVHILYLTAFVDEWDSVHFRDDVYRRDEFGKSAGSLATGCAG